MKNFAKVALGALMMAGATVATTAVTATATATAAVTATHESCTTWTGGVPGLVSGFGRHPSQP